MPTPDPKELLDADRRHLWHPYASMVDPAPVYPVRSASGVRLQLEDGRELIDGMSSWWCAIHGYGVPELDAAARRQLDAMSHVMFGGLTHRPAVDLALALVRLTPEPLQQVFFCDSGSVSVEVAIKMALQYGHARGKPEKQRLLTIRGGYHGDTFGAMAVCDPVNGMHHRFAGVLPEHLFAAAPRCGPRDPWDEADIDDLRAKLERHGGEIAAVILEPIVQGAGGMRFYSPHYLRRARELCDAHDVLLIFDEIATGFGRTGSMFALEQAEVVPDILCLGKALTGGYATLAATLTTRRVSEVISEGGRGVFMHGPTFMANPLACAIALASIELLEASPWRTRVARIEARLAEGLAPCADFGCVQEVRCLGAIGVVELTTPVAAAEIQRRFVERGVWIRPFGKLVYLMPPFVIDDADLAQLTSTIVEVLQDPQVLASG